jgi:hypothetical protein
MLDSVERLHLFGVVGMSCLQLLRTLEAAEGKLPGWRPEPATVAAAALCCAAASGVWEAARANHQPGGLASKLRELCSLAAAASSSSSSSSSSVQAALLLPAALPVALLLYARQGEAAVVGELLTAISSQPGCLQGVPQVGLNAALLPVVRCAWSRQCHC